MTASRVKGELRSIEWWRKRTAGREMCLAYGEGPEAAREARSYEVAFVGLVGELVETEWCDERFDAECNGYDEAVGPRGPLTWRYTQADEDAWQYETNVVELCVGAAQQVRWNARLNHTPHEDKAQIAAKADPAKRRGPGGTRRPRVMGNRYPGPCRECGLTVPANAGLLEPNHAKPGAWRVRHKNADACAEAWARSAEPVPPPTPAPRLDFIDWTLIYEREGA